jgi:tetratricopeptide (TPR) repeat protein
MATGDAFLNYDQPAKAEEFYTKALGMAGANKERAMTRLGIAQLDQGKTAEAQETFAKVAGARRAIALLWDAYAGNQAAGTTTATAVTEPAT